MNRSTQSSKTAEGGAKHSSLFSRQNTREGSAPWVFLIYAAVTALVILLCVCVGSVTVPPGQTLRILFGRASESVSFYSIIRVVRLPRVLCVALTGASLSLCGAAMQGLLKNPLADGSTLGVSSGTSLGAVLSIALGLTFPALPFAGTMVMAILFAFLSLVVIMSLAYKFDNSLSTNTIILIGIIFSMFANAILSLIITFAHDKLRTITFWTMGSLAGSSYGNALVLAVVLFIGSIIIISRARELNAFAIGEDNARNIGVNVKAVRISILITVAALIGVCVSIGGTIAFVGLVAPHIIRFITGPNHKRLLPAAVFGGAVFLMFADLVARTLLRPLELPLGVVTSLVGAVLFVIIFYRSRRKG